MRYARMVMVLLVCTIMCPIGAAQQLRNQVCLSEGKQQPTYVHLCSKGQWMPNPPDGKQARVAICAWNAADKQETIISEDSGSYLCVSARGLIAFMKIAEGYTGGPNPKTLLRVINSSGKELRTLSTVKTIRDLDWSPDGKRLVFLVGLEAEEFGKYFEAEIFIYDVERGEAQKIFDGGYQVQWAPFDGRIYIYDLAMTPHVHAYDPCSRKVQPTEYHGVYFSPGGRYYYVPQYDPSGMELYVRATNERVASLPSSPVAGEALNLKPRMWLNDEWLIGMIENGEQKPPYYLLDASTGEVLKCTDSVVSAYTADSVVVQRPDGEYDTESIQDMTSVKPHALPLPVDHMRK